ncbi:hypothetical protein M9458_012307, partial [Cirrhinus mrigala]
SSLDEGGVFDCLKPDSPTSPQQLFSGLVGVSAGNVSSAPFQAAGLVLDDILIEGRSTIIITIIIITPASTALLSCMRPPLLRGTGAEMMEVRASVFTKPVTT